MTISRGGSYSRGLSKGVSDDMVYLDMIKIRVNGEDFEVQSGMTVRGLLSQLKLIVERVAVEYNEKILRRSEYETTVIREKDQLEIIHFIGGGCYA